MRDYYHLSIFSFLLRGIKCAVITALFFSSVNIYAQAEKINWVSFEEAVQLNEKEPRKFIVDVYTDWCGWCKRMDQTTFKNPEVAQYINEKYWAVKLNAEI